MLKKNEVLPVGTIVSVRSKNNDDCDIYIVIIGHLSIRKEFKCVFDYIGVYYPEGYSNQCVFLNHGDIFKVIQKPVDIEELHESWIEHKYDEFRVLLSSIDDKKRLSFDDWEKAHQNTIVRQKKANRRRVYHKAGVVFSAIFISVISIWIFGDHSGLPFIIMGGVMGIFLP